MTDDHTDPPPTRRAARPAADDRVCPSCGAATDLDWEPATEAVIGSVAAALERRPVRRCPLGHRSSAAEVAETANRMVRDALLHARRSRLRGDRCATCREPLTLPARRTGRSVTIAGSAVAVHTLHLDVPVIRCGECGQDQVPTRSHADLAAAVAAAYEPT